MTDVRWGRLPALGVGLLLACGGGGGAGTGPCSPGAATQLVKSGDGQSWYFNNPLPTLLSVTARDANSCPVPGLVINWAVTAGGGGVSPAQSTTNANGVASTTDSVGSAPMQTVTATPGTAGPTAQAFTQNATAAPTAAAVSVADFSFSPQAVVIQSGGTVTWTWGGAAPHDVSYDGGPTPLPTGSGTPKTTGTHQNTITPLGRYTYHCSVHAGMTGSVTVVH
jgi:plastocyanin